MPKSPAENSGNNKKQYLREKSRQGELVIEVGSDGDSERVSSRSNAFEKGMDLIRNCAQEIYSNATRMPESAQPNKMTVEFSVRFKVNGEAVLSENREDGQLRVSMSWQKAGDSSGSSGIQYR